MGSLAKTDRLDARLPAELGRLDRRQIVAMMRDGRPFDLRPDQT